MHGGDVNSVQETLGATTKLFSRNVPARARFEGGESSVNNKNGRRAAYVLIPVLLAVCASARADITVSPGASNPAYPGAEPDPWNAGTTLELDENVLTIDNTSQVSADTLFIDGRAIVNSSGLLDVDATTLLTAPAGSASAASIYVDNATVNAGSFTSVDDAVLYLGIDNNGLFTTDTASGLGSGSTIVINLDNGGQYQGTGNTAFGGNGSSFTLGPPVTAPGANDPDIAGNTALAEAARTASQDAASDDVDSATADTDTIPPGGAYTFKITGDGTFGGTGSDATVYVDAGSSFEVTGDAAFANGGSSIVDIVALDATFTVGNDFTVTRSADSSTSFYFVEAIVDVGNDWLMGDEDGGSVITLDAFESTLDVGGAFDLRQGGGSSFEMNFGPRLLGDNLPAQLSVGGDILLGNLSVGGNSALSVSFGGGPGPVTTVTGGNYFSRVGNFSVQGLDSLRTHFNLTGDFRAETGQHIAGTTSAGDGQSTSAYSMDNVEITANDFAIETLGDTNIQVIDWFELMFDLSGSFLIGMPNMHLSNGTVSIVDTTGEVDGDFTIRFTEGFESSWTIFIDGLDIMIGGDLYIDYSPGNTSAANTSTSFFDNFSPTVGGDLHFDAATAADSTTTATFTNSNPTIAGNASFDFTNPFSSSTAEAKFVDSTFTVTGMTTFHGGPTFTNATFTSDVFMRETVNMRLPNPVPIAAGSGLAVNGKLSLNNNAVTSIILNSADPSDVFEHVVHNDTAQMTLRGKLAVEFDNDFQNTVSNSDTFTIVTSNSPLAGAFANVLVGERLPTADGHGSFLLTDNPAGDTLFLSNFEPPAADTDGDGMSDDFEGGSDLEPGEDDDSDGLTNLEEFNLGELDPGDPDTDGDGIGDAFDKEPKTHSNLCGGVNAIFNGVVPANATLQCAASNQVTIDQTGMIDANNGRLEVFAPTTTVSNGFSVPLGAALSISSMDPVPGAIPGP